MTCKCDKMVVIMSLTFLKGKLQINQPTQCVIRGQLLHFKSPSKQCVWKAMQSIPVSQCCCSVMLLQHCGHTVAVLSGTALKVFYTKHLVSSFYLEKTKKRFLCKHQSCVSSALMDRLTSGPLLCVALLALFSSACTVTVSTLLKSLLISSC